MASRTSATGLRINFLSPADFKDYSRFTNFNSTRYFLGKEGYKESHNLKTLSDAGSKQKDSGRNIAASILIIFNFEPIKNTNRLKIYFIKRQKNLKCSSESRYKKRLDCCTGKLISVIDGNSIRQSEIRIHLAIFGIAPKNWDCSRNYFKKMFRTKIKS